MSNYKLEKDEIILLEGQARVEEFKSEVRYVLTSKNILFEKEKGILKKSLKVVYKIPLENIKVYKDKIQIIQKKSDILIYAIDKTITISCSNTMEALKIKEKIIEAKTGHSKFKRGINKVAKVIADNPEVVTACVTVGVAIATQGKGNVVKKGVAAASKALKDLKK